MIKSRLGKTNLKTLGLVAVGVLAAAIALNWNKNRSSGGQYARKKLFGSLKLDAVDRVKISSADNNISLKKVSDEQWVMENRAGYPVEPQRLAKLVIALANLEPIDRMTDNPEKYDKMGVGDAKPEMGRIEVLDKDQKVLAGLRLGKPRTPPGDEDGFTPPDGQYVRADGDAYVYLLPDQLQLDTLSETWLVKDVLTTKQEEIQQVRVEHAATTESLTIARTGGDPFKITSPIPEGYKETATKVQNLSRAISSITLSDVLSASDPKVAEITFDQKFTATHKNGLVIEIQGGTLTSEKFVKIAASHDPSADHSSSDERTSDSVTAKAMEKAEVTVKNLNDKHSPWVYKLQSYQYDNIMRKLSEVIEQNKIPAEESVGPEAPPVPLAMPDPAPAEDAPAEDHATEQPPPVEDPPAEAPPAGEPPAETDSGT